VCAHAGPRPTRIRALLGEFGFIVPQGIGDIATHVPALIEDGASGLPCAFRLLVQRLPDHLKELDRQVEELENKIHAWHRISDLSGTASHGSGHRFHCLDPDARWTRVPAGWNVCSLAKLSFTFVGRKTATGAKPTGKHQQFLGGRG
jgi:hypothetical protein